MEDEMGDDFAPYVAQLRNQLFLDRDEGEDLLATRAAPQGSRVAIEPALSATAFARAVQDFLGEQTCSVSES